MAVLAVIGRILAQMGMALLTEKMIKRAVVIGLEKLVARTPDDSDNKLLAEAKKAWGLE